MSTHSSHACHVHSWFPRLSNPLVMALPAVLAQHGYLEDSSFVRYLEYLEYWRQPEYVRFIK